MRRAFLLAIFSSLLCFFISGCDERDSGITTQTIPHPQIKPIAVTADMSLGKAAYTHTANIVAYGPRPSATLALKSVREYTMKQLQRAGWSAKLQRTQSKLPQAASKAVGKSVYPFNNVRARFGSDDSVWQKTPTAILCAHIDSKLMAKEENFVGADDAASALAAILVIAREFSHKHPAIAGEIEIVFFDGEESLGEHMMLHRDGMDGIYGSRSYARIWTQASAKPRFGLLLDMIGHKNLSIVLPSIGKEPSNSPAHLVKPLIAAGQRQGRDVISVGPIPILDDHLPLNLAGIPTIDMIGDFSSTNWWHHAKGGRDDMSIISEDSLDFSIRTAIDFLTQQISKHRTQPK